MRIVVVHGGGPEISQHCQHLQMPVHFHQGQRITDQETMQITQMILLGKINANLVKKLNGHQVQAVGISGLDSGFLQAKKFASLDSVDLGFVGEVAHVNTQLINTLLEKNFLPVIAPIGVDSRGDTYNINADTVAGAIAAALQAEKLVLLSDVNGLYADAKDSNTRISTITMNKIETWLQENKISGGMIPKLRACLYALQKGIGCAHILDGRIQHSLLLEIFTDEGIGTMITA
jgi:acetylglutamate kinase